MSLPSYVYDETIGDIGSIPIANHPASSPGDSKEENIPTDADIFPISELGYDPQVIAVTEIWDGTCVYLSINCPVTLAANEDALENMTVTEFWDRTCVDLSINCTVILAANENALEDMTVTKFISCPVTLAANENVLENMTVTEFWDRTCVDLSINFTLTLAANETVLEDMTVTEFWDRTCVNLDINCPVTLKVDENTQEGPVAAHMTQNDESLTPQQEASAYSQNVQNTPMSFPTLAVFAPRLSGLVPYPSIDPQYDSAQPSSVVQGPEQGRNLAALVASHPSAYYPQRGIPPIS